MDSLLAALVYNNMSERHAEAFISFIRRELLCSHLSLLLLLFFEHLKYFDLCVDLKGADHRFHHHHHQCFLIMI